MSKEVLCNIFTLQGIKNESQIKIKHVDNVTLKEHEFVPDTLVNKFNIDKDINGEIYVCNITNSFLMLSKKLPMTYISVIYEKPLKNILLFRVYLYFTVNEEIKSTKQLLENNINGTFHLEISIENSKKEIKDGITKYPGDEKMQKKLTDFALADEMKELSKNLVAEINEKIKQEYEKEFEYFKLPTKIISLKNYKID